MKNAIKCLRPIGIAMFAVLVGPILQSEHRIAAQDPMPHICHTCTMECPYGSGYYCEPNGDGGGGTTGCRMAVLEWPNPVDPDEEGHVDCLCVPLGDLCRGDEEGIDVADRTRQAHEATDVVASGAMLPSNGRFYFGVAGEELVVRWKCDGSVAGRVALADVSPVVAGALAG